MPVSQAVDNGLSLFVFRFYDRVGEEDVTGAIDAVAAEADHAGTYRSLLIFERSTDLSELTLEALGRIKEQMKLVYGRVSVRRRAGAAVLDSSFDAKAIMPLWDALCEGDPDLELQYELFTDLEPARRWLGIGREECAELVGRTGGTAA